MIQTMTTLVLEGYIVKEQTDKGKMFYFSNKPDGQYMIDGMEYSISESGDCCFEIDLPIRNFLDTNCPQRCKLTIELEK